MRLVRVVTRVRSPRSMRSCISSIKVVYLIMAGTHLDGRVEQPRGTDDLFHHHSAALHQLVVGGGRADVYHLLGHLLELVETSAGGCPAQRADGSHTPRGSPCANGRPRTWPLSGATLTWLSSMTIRKVAGKEVQPGNRGACRRLVRRSSASSSLCPSSGPARAASPCRR